MSIVQRIGEVLTGRRTDERLRDLERTVRKLGEAERDRAVTIQARVSELVDAAREQPTGKDLREFKEALRGVTGQQRDYKRLFQEIDRVAVRQGPLLIGPWTGEVGFELLYWIPFVEWVRAHWNLSPARELVVSRGGVDSWYRRDPSQYADIFSLFDPDDVRAAVADEKRKHRRPGVFDARVTEAVAKSREQTEFDALHPGLMYRLFAPYWSDTSGYSLISQFTRPRLLAPPAITLPDGLPSNYVAVRFYFSECFPPTDENRQFTRAVVNSLAERSPVVVLNPGFRADEHTDWVPEAHGRIVGISDGMSPARNLAVQSAVIAGARSFVGTYGGYSYLAPLYKVPAIAFYSRPSFKLQHLHAAQRSFAAIGAAPLLPIDVAHADLVRTALGAVVAA
jgi:hypothetical protein